MQTLRKLLDFYLDASIHVALAVLSLYWVTVYFLNLSPNFYLAGFVFFGSLVFYNIAKDSIGLHAIYRPSKRYYRSIRFLSMAGLLAAVFFFFQLSGGLRWRAMLIALFAGLYVLPMPGRRQGLRNSGWLKIFWVGLSWAAVTVYLPIAVVPNADPQEWGIMALKRVLMVTSLMIPFEIRDACTDPVSMRTLPQRYGISSTRWLGYVMLLAYFFLIFFRGRFTPVELLFDFLFCVLMFAGIRYSSPRRNRYYATFWIESVPIVLWLGMRWWVNFG